MPLTCSGTPVADAKSILDDIRMLEGTSGAVVWRSGDAPIGNLPETVSTAAPGLLSSSIGSMEQVAHAVGLGRIEQLWFLTGGQQCLAVRVDEWQAVIVAARDVDIDRLRHAVMQRLQTHK